MDAGQEGKWLTYAELADARGIDRQSARRMANRTHWRRQKDNHGVVRVYVPLAQAERQRRQRDISADTPAVMPADMSAVTRPLEAAIAILRKQLELANSRAEQAEAGRDAERSRADALRDRIKALQVQLATAEAGDGSALTIETAKLTAQLNQARRQVQEAQEAAGAIRQVRSRTAGARRAGAIESSMASRVTAGRRPMADFTVTMDVIKRISEIETPHGKALNEDITEAFPDNPDAAYTLAVGFSVATLLGSFSDPAERANVVDGVNVLVRRMGCVLTPVT